MTTYAQDIRNALRALGGTANAEDIADRCECDIDAGSVSKQLWGGEKQSWVLIDRTARPFHYTLIEERASAVEAFGKLSPSAHDKLADEKPASTRKKREAPEHTSRTRIAAPGKAKRELLSRQTRAMHSEPAPASTLGAALSLDSTAGCSVDRSRVVSTAAPPRVQHEADAPTPSPAARLAATTLAEEIDRYQTATLPRAQVLRLCALALSPDDRTPADLRDIANAIKAAA